MKLLTLVALILAATPVFADGERWVRDGSIRGSVGTNYTAFAEHDGRVYLLTGQVEGPVNGVYSNLVMLQSTDSLPGRLGSPENIVPRSELARYQDERGTPMTYARTNAIASDGEACHALLHVGAPYGTPSGYNYRPAYASSQDCRTWTYHGPVSVNGIEAPPIFSGSMAYVVSDGRHFMLQDSGAYGYGNLVVFVSDDGMNYRTYGGDIQWHPGDSAVFPDMAYCGGQYHVVYEDGWGNGTNRIRHLASYDLLNWSLLDDSIEVTHYKGLNIGCVAGELMGVNNREVWKWTADAGPGKPGKPGKPKKKSRGSKWRR